MQHWIFQNNLYKVVSTGNLFLWFELMHYYSKTLVEVHMEALFYRSSLWSIQQMNRVNRWVRMDRTGAYLSAGYFINATVLGGHENVFVCLPYSKGHTKNCKYETSGEKWSICILVSVVFICFMYLTQA